MRRTVFAVLCALTACGPAAVEDEVAVAREAILGGKANYGDPEVFMLSIRYPSGLYSCTSTLVSPRLLLTAAHCLAPEGGVLPTVRATNAAHSAFAGSRGWIAGTRLFSHPDFDPENFSKGSDIAAVELEREPFAPTKPWNQEPIDEYSKKLKPLRITGYGITHDAAIDSGLKRVTTTTLGEVLRVQFNFGSGLAATCSGDSGGPAFFTFADGVERTIGVTSGHRGGCGSGFDTRIDIYKANVAEWIAAAETGACESDGRCNAGCGNDPDCACKEDGVCSTSAVCTGLSADPDCVASCARDGVCSRAACTSPDVDCSPLGAPCGRDQHCGGRKCINSEQVAGKYCSRACDAANACPNGYDCLSNVCQVKALPVVSAEQPCTPGATSCGSPEWICKPAPSDTTNRCRHQCFEDRDCPSGSKCSEKFEVPAFGVCVPDIVLPRLANEEGPAGGCAAIPAGWPALALLVLARRRRSQG